jgi:adenosylcobinamide-GDP ribazoletransferase
MLIIDILSSIVIAFAFFTIIPMPRIDWTGRRMQFAPLMMSLVGLVNGLIAFGLFTFLTTLNFSEFFKAVIMCLYYVVYTGGLHIDGLLDTADAYFSRRDKQRKLEIMKDSTVGAFAVITLLFIFLLKTAVFNELFTHNYKNGIILIFIPIISRLLQSSMLYIFPPAKPDGLTRMFGVLDKRYSTILFALFALIGTMLFILIGIKSLILIITIIAYYALFYFSSKKQFGGITGDLLGAFLEVSELVMLTTLLFI